MPRSSLLAAASIIGSMTLAGCAGASPVSAVSAATVCDMRTSTALAPATGALFGVNLDWGKQTLAQYTEALGKRPAVAVSFTDLPMNDTDMQNVTAAAAQVRLDGGTLLLTLEPKQGLAAVTDQVVADLAALLDQINATGVPVIVRFAHEMNGSWYAWGQQPGAYVAAFRAVAAAVHADAPGSAMMWAPNYAGGYPFTGGPTQATPGTPDHAALDTNGDGAVTATDDAYAPYYPGDDVVDWVGMSLYHWGSAHPWGENEMPEPGKFAAQLTGTYVGAGGDESSAPDFYDVYGVQHGKPVAIPETAALVVPGPAGTADVELAIKQAWWRQVLAPDIATRFPQLRMVNWFEWDKHEPEVNAVVHWSVTDDAKTRDVFVADLPAWVRFAAEPTPCDGTA